MANKLIKTCNVCLKQFTGRGVIYCSLKCNGFACKKRIISLETRLKMRIAKLGTKQSQETIEKRKMFGIKNPRWIEDRTKIRLSDRNFHDPNYKQWHKAVKDRDKWTCRIADNNCAGRLEAHHILPWSKFPELRYQTNNGITLCHAHHPRKREEEAKLSPFFQSLVAEMN